MQPELSNTPSTSPFSQRLREFREERKLSKSDLAESLNISTNKVVRWESGAANPSPSEAQRLRTLGFGPVEESETNQSTVPLLKQITVTSDREKTVVASELREQSDMSVSFEGDSPTRIIPAPWVRNGPPDQRRFYQDLIEMQSCAHPALHDEDLAARMSLVEFVEGHGFTAQFSLEGPKPTSLSWNSNYGPHGWHRYVGRFPPHVIRAILNRFGAGSNSVVCDPFLGSGTTAVECRLLGIPFVGVEICPLSVLMSRTKAQFPRDPSVIEVTASEFGERYHSEWTSFTRGRDPKTISHDEILNRPENPIPRFANIENWFTSEAFLGVSIAMQIALNMEGYQRQALLLALSSRMRSIGNVNVDVVRAQYRNKPRKGVDVAQLVISLLNRMIRDIKAVEVTHGGMLGSEDEIRIIEGSALEVGLDPHSIDFIITSPPYGVEVISYLRTHLLSYRSLVAELGHDPYDVRDQTIGSEYLESGWNVSIADIPSKSLSTFFKNREEYPKKLQVRRDAMVKFFSDMHDLGKRMVSWLKPGGEIAFIIGNKKLGSEVIPTDTIIRELFEDVGLRCVESLSHKLKTNNSNSQVPWQSRIIQDESILFFEKSTAG